MKLHPAQDKIASDRHRFRVLRCGRRWGKTQLAILEMTAAAFSKNDRHIAYIAPNYQQARDIAWRELKKQTLSISVNTNEQRLEIEVKTQKGGTSFIWLRGWESVETLRGQKFNFLILDEVAMYRNFWENWHEVLRPTLTDERGEALFLSTPKAYNHFYDLYKLEEKDHDYKSSTYDNPHIPKEEIEKAKIELTDDRFQQEYMASFRKAHGLVYKEFDRYFHVTELNAPLDIKEIILGVDFGYTNPSGILTIKKDFNNVYWITNEYYKTGKVNIDLIEYAKTQKSHVVYPDPAEPDRIEEFKRHGLNCRDVNKDIEAGINKVRELFKAKRIQIHESSYNRDPFLLAYKDHRNDCKPLVC